MALTLINFFEHDKFSVEAGEFSLRLGTKEVGVDITWEQAEEIGRLADMRRFALAQGEVDA